MATSQASPVTVSPKITGSTPFALKTAAAASSERCAVAMTLFSTRANTGSPRLRGLVGALLQPQLDGARWRNAVAGEDLHGVGVRGRIGRAGPRGDVRGIVAGHVGDDERDDRRAQAAQTPAVDRRAGACAPCSSPGWRRRCSASSRVTALSSAMETPGAGQREQARAAAGRRARSRSSGLKLVLSFPRISRAAASPASSGTGWPASTTRMRSGWAGRDRSA